MIVENPKLKDADKYKDDVFLLSAVKGSPYFKGVKAKDIWRLKFWEVEKVKRWFQDLNDENINKIMQLFYSDTNFNNVRCLEFYRAFNYIKESLAEVYNKEKLLSSERNQKLIDAGIEELNIFGSLNLLDDLGKDFGKSPNEIENWEYGLVFSLSLKRKKESEIQKRLNK